MLATGAQIPLIYFGVFLHGLWGVCWPDLSVFLIYLFNFFSRAIVNFPLGFWVSSCWYSLSFLFRIRAAKIMHFTAWKSVSLCSALFFNRSKKKGGSASIEGRTNVSSVLKELQEIRLREALEEASEDGLFSKSQTLLAEEESSAPLEGKNGILHSRTLVRLKAQRDFLAATANAAERLFNSEESIPVLDEAYAKFKEMYPKFVTTEKVDELRSEEYGHLEASLKVCLDYCGFGLFSYLQHLECWESSSFGLSEVSVNLSSHALNGISEEGTSEHDIRNRIMDYLSISQNEYSMVFTVSRGSAFKLLAESYPFHQNRRLLTMYDYESESVNWMAQTAKEKGAKVQSAWFRWPTLRICGTELRKQLQHKKKRRKDSAVGLLVFPVQSRVTGAKYSYQWMSLAQQNRWHVLLDAGALGPKDMDSLGLSLFRPDFIITSFYKIFGADPTGFGCLFIKNSVIGCLRNQVGGASGAGMVRIVPVSPQYLSDSAEGRDGTIPEEEKASESGAEDDEFVPEMNGGLQLPAFSGPFSSVQVRDVFESEMDCDNSSGRDGASTVCEDEERLSVEDLMKSPVYSEEENEDLMCIDLGESPLAPKTSDHSKSSSSSKLGLRQLHDGFSHRIKLKQSFIGSRAKSSTVGAKIGPIYDEDNQDLNIKDKIISFDAAISSVSQELEEAKAASDAAAMVITMPVGGTCSTSSGNEKCVGAQSSSRLQVKQETPQMSNALDHGDYLYKGQEKSLPDLNPSKTNGKSVTCGSHGHNLILEGEAGTARNMGSQKYPKQTKITFNLEKGGLDSAELKTEDIDIDRGHISEKTTYSTGEASQSISDELTVWNEDDKHVTDALSGSKDRVENANASPEIQLREPGKVSFAIGSKQSPMDNGYKLKENSIRRETEGVFRLLGRREADRFSGSRLSDLDEDRINSMGRRVPFYLEDHVEKEAYFDQSGEESEVVHCQEEEATSVAENAEEQETIRREPQIFCKHLDHVDMMGLNKTTLRLRYLINWLVTSLLQLRHPSPDGGVPLVHIYGPKIRYDRGAAVAFNLYDHRGALVNPELVQKLAEKNMIALGLGFLSHLRLMESYAELQEALDSNNTSFCKPMANGRYEGKNVSIRVEVVTASLGFLSNFEDVYRMWAFVAKFLNASFAKGDGC